MKFMKIKSVNKEVYQHTRYIFYIHVSIYAYYFITIVQTCCLNWQPFLFCNLTMFIILILCYGNLWDYYHAVVTINSYKASMGNNERQKHSV